MARKKQLGSRVTPKKERSPMLTVYGDASGPKVLLDEVSGRAFGFCCVCDDVTELNTALSPNHQRCALHLFA